MPTDAPQLPPPPPSAPPARPPPPSVPPLPPLPPGAPQLLVPWRLAVPASAELLREGGNSLVVTLDVPEAAPCGVLVRGAVGRYARWGDAALVSNAATRAELHVPRLRAGTVVVVQQGATNDAGLAGTTQSGRLILDDTPPHAPAQFGCTINGRTDPQGRFWQASTDELALCWAAPGWVDAQSGVWRLEWQLARWVADSGAFTVDGVTVALPPNASSVAVAAGELRLSSAELRSRGYVDLTNAGTYKLALRAVNRAGLYSCDGCAAQAEAWSLSHGSVFSVDQAPPFCSNARARSCACDNVHRQGNSRAIGRQMGLSGSRQDRSMGADA